MALTFHHPGAEQIPRTGAHALLHAEALQQLRRRPGTIGRVAIEAWCDAMHERLTREGVPHVCQVNGATGRIQQLWVVAPKDVLTCP